MNDDLNWAKIARRIRVPLGFVFAGLFLAMARPTLRTLLASLALVLPGLLLRGYASGYVRKNAELTTTGPYAHTRNPLYLGSMLLAFGFAVAGGRWSIGVVLAALFLAIYFPVIRSEEQYLHAKFPAFAGYARRVPRLLPRLTPATAESPPGKFSHALYMLHREYNSLMGAGAIYLALLLRFLLRR